MCIVAVSSSDSFTSRLHIQKSKRAVSAVWRCRYRESAMYLCTRISIIAFVVYQRCGVVSALRLKPACCRLLYPQHDSWLSSLCMCISADFFGAARCMDVCRRPRVLLLSFFTGSLNLPDRGAAPPPSDRWGGAATPYSPEVG